MKIFKATVFTIIFSLTLFSQQRFEITFNMGYEGGQKPTFIDFKPTDSINLDKAHELFQDIKNKSGIEFRYSYGGCEDRAHAVALLLAEKGLNTKKIWNFNPYSISLFNSFQSPSIRDKTGLNAKVFWGFHVAVVILVNENEKLTKMIFDPAVADNLISIDEWLKLQEAPSSYYTFTDREWFSFYTIDGRGVYRNNKLVGYIPDQFANLLTGDFIKNEGINYDQQWVEEGLAVNEVAMKITEEIINKESSDKSNFFRNLVTNINNLTEILKKTDVSNQSGNYSEDIAKYQVIFNQRKEYWKQRLDSVRKKMSGKT